MIHFLTCLVNMWADLLVNCGGLSRGAAIIPDKSLGGVWAAPLPLCWSLSHAFDCLAHTHTQLTWCGDGPSRLSNQTFLISRILQAQLESSALLLTSLQLDWKPTREQQVCRSPLHHLQRQMKQTNLWQTAWDHTGRHAGADRCEQGLLRRPAPPVHHTGNFQENYFSSSALTAPTHQCERASGGDKPLLVSVLLIS